MKVVGFLNDWFKNNKKSIRKLQLRFNFRRL